MDFLESVILTLLSLDTVRAVIAMLGWVKPDAKFAWLIYGRYERNLVKAALKDMGFSEEKAARIYKDMNHISDQISNNTGIQEEDAAVQLIILLSKYIVKFKQPIQYGGRNMTRSHFYLNTMEMSHNLQDKKDMVAIMVHLMNQHISKKPGIIFTPKAGNPLFAHELASVFGANLVLAKSPSDKSRVSTVTPGANNIFDVNYEGLGLCSREINDYNYVVLDCNTSRGSQLLDLIHDIRQLTKKDTKTIKVFVLFRLDDNEEDIDKKFENHKSELIRFFDLNEDSKRLLYKMQQRCKKEHRSPSFYNDDDVKEAKEILNVIKSKGNLFYDTEEMYVSIS